MSGTSVIFRLVVTVLVSTLAIDAGAQTPAGPQPYEPRVGQPGKDVVWVPTPDATVEAMLDLANVTPADSVIDLGSGDGRLVIAAARRGARALGIEFNAEMVDLARRRASEAGVADRASFTAADLFEADLTGATVISMFLLPDINLKLRPRLFDLEPGTRIVSNTFAMDDWVADESVTLDECENWCLALLWIVPAKVDGAWQLGSGTLRFVQTFQEISGTLGETLLTDAVLRGDEIAFSVGPTRYAGRVRGDVMEGTMSGDRQGTWTAGRR